MAESWQDFQAALAWLLGLQLLDLLTTLGALAQGASEANPWVAMLMESSGPVALVRLKLIAMVAMLGWLPAYSLVQGRGAARSRMAWAMLALVVGLAVVYSAVVFNNLVVFQTVLAR